MSSAHPRSRGEHTVPAFAGSFRVGSSPLARGTFWKPNASRNLTRLIPARAGNIEPFPKRRTLQAAHPRSRGEHFQRAACCCVSSGSSPLARGTSRFGHLREALSRLIPARAGNMLRYTGTGTPVRLIPARAGNILSARDLRNTLAAHPRSRGEHPSVVCEVSVIIGSSPLARGTYPGPCNEAATARLIPARAGNISMRRPCGARLPAHPRSRGEH